MKRTQLSKGSVSRRNDILTEAQRCINLAIESVTAPDDGAIDKNAVVLDLNAAYGLIQTVKGM